MDKARSATAAAFYNYENVILKAFRDVEDALVSHTLLLRRLVAQDHLIKAAAEYEYLAMLQYKEGYAPLFCRFASPAAAFSGRTELGANSRNFIYISSEYLPSYGRRLNPVLAECKTENF